MAISYDQTGKLFQVDYQSPFGGIDSSAFASAIDPHNFVDNNSCFIEDNIIKPIYVQRMITGAFTGERYIGFAPLSNVDPAAGLNALGYAFTDHAVYRVNALGVDHLVNYTPALGAGSAGIQYLVVDHISTTHPDIYITYPQWNEIWVYSTAANTMTLLTNYIGGGVLGLLNNQLMVFGGISGADGLVPNRISWSAPGAYGNFQPYDVTSGTGDYSAGFNDLPSTSDALTGFAAIGTVGYLFRNQGITQVNPTGNGILPFQFNHLWASELGIGAAYPNSISQYGATVGFTTDVGIYSLSIAGLAEIGASARSYIYKLLNNSIQPDELRNDYNVQGRVLPYTITSPELTYFLGFYNPDAGAWQFISVGLTTGKVVNLGQMIPVGLGNFAVLQISFALKYLTSSATATKASRQISPLLIVSQFGSPTSNSLATFYIPTYYALGIAPASVLFRKEQMKFGYQPTVSKVALLAALIDPTADGFISTSIDGGQTFNTAFPDLLITAGVGNVGQGIIDNIYIDGVQTLERPQLMFKFVNVQIAEAWYQGTLADFPLI